VDKMTEEIYTKDPDAVLDYAFDWATWLDSDSSPAETISSHTITISGGGDSPISLTNDSDSEASGIVTVWLSGGTAGNIYTVSCEIVTDSATPRTEERSITIIVQER